MILTIGRKISLLVGAAAVGLMLILGLTWQQISKVYEATNFANVNTLPSWRDLGTATDAVADLRAILWESTYRTDEQERKQLLSKATSLRQLIGDALKKYEAEDMDEPQDLYVPDKANLEASRAALADFDSVMGKVQTALAENKADDARNALWSTRALQQRINASFAAHRKLNMDFAMTAATEAASTYKQALWICVAVVIATLLGVALWGLYIAQGMSRSLAAAVKAADQVAAGNLASEIECGSSDEAGQVLQAQARMQTNLVQLVTNVRLTAESVATASAEIAQGNQDLSQRTEEQASALQQTAATIEQLGSIVRNNADNARQANQLAQTAADVATHGGTVVGQVVSTMQGISDSSTKIGDIIGVIDGIAFQTNILALNAAVEAARAGEQGRGFAVVASEVRTLAQRSAEAAKEIKNLIVRNVEQVEQGATLVGQAGKTMEEIVDSIKRVSDIVSEISSATTEQSSGIQQVGDAVGQMDQVTQQNAALVEESAAAAESLKNQAHQLVQAVSVFKLASG